VSPARRHKQVERLSWALLILGALGAGRGVQEPQLLFPGDNWAQNVHTKSGDVWLVLRNDAGISALASARVVLTKNNQEDFRPVVVSIKEGFDPVFMIRSIPGVSAGKVRTLFQGRVNLGVHHGAGFNHVGSSQADVYVGGFPRETKLLPGGRHSEKGYTLRVTSDLGRVHQEIMSLGSVPVENPTLLWAGDLDHDGKLDLLLDVETGETMGATYQLWLSTFAKDNEFVGLAVALRDPAC
jgi:hypothetical protein